MKLRDFALTVGIDEQDVTAAERQGLQTLALLVAGQVTLPLPRRYTRPEVRDRAGVADETAQRLWRAMGFPDVPADQIYFTDADVEALKAAARLVDSGLLDLEETLQQTRVMSQALARVAASHLETVSQGALDVEDPEAALVARLTDARERLSAVDAMIVYFYRRHLAAGGERLVYATLGGDPDSAGAAVGFADLVGYTAVSSRLPEAALARLIESFSNLASAVVSSAGGRVVKMIGDEVMFLADDAGTAARIALDLVDQVPALTGDELGDELQLRCGLAWGPVVHHEGDIFGRTVNLASRLTSVARPGTVVAGADLAEQLAGEEDLVSRPIPARTIKGIGHVRAVAVRRAE
jgi:adenylate cyclase